MGGKSKILTGVHGKDVGELHHGSIRELPVGVELAALERDVAVLDHARHGDLAEILAVAVTVLDFFALHHQAGDFGEADLGAAPVYLEVESRQRIGLGHESSPFGPGQDAGIV